MLLCSAIPESFKGRWKTLVVGRRALLERLSAGESQFNIACSMKVSPETVEESVEKACQHLGVDTLERAIHIIHRLEEEGEL